MIQLAASGPRVVKDNEWAVQKQEFAQRHCVVLEGFIDEALLPRLARLAETGQYEARENGPEGTVLARELAMPPDQPLARAFDVLLNQRRLFEAIAELTGTAEEILGVHGRCHQRLPERNHFSRWHSDRGLGRLCGLSISLSTLPETGGVFQIRHRKTKEMLQTIPRLKAGDARLFRIHRTLEHRVSSVTEPYRGYAGWFLGGEKNDRYQDVMREKLVRRQPCAAPWC